MLLGEGALRPGLGIPRFSTGQRHCGRQEGPLQRLGPGLEEAAPRGQRCGGPGGGSEGQLHGRLSLLQGLCHTVAHPGKSLVQRS